MKIVKKITSCIMSILVFTFLNSSVLIANTAYASDEDDLKREVLTDSFVKSIEMHLEDIRNIEYSYDYPVTKSDLNEIEYLYDDQLDLLDNELIRLSDENFTQRERLEIESVLIEIHDQFSRTLDELEDKVESDASDDFDELSDDLLEASLFYRKSLSMLLEEKLKSPILTKTQILNDLSQASEDIEDVITYLRNATDRLENNNDEIPGSDLTSNALTSITNKVFDILEDADDELRKLSYVSSSDSYDLKQTIREIQSALNDFYDELEDKYSSSFEDQTRDSLKTIEYVEDQLDSSLSEVLANKNDVDPAVEDVIEEIESLTVRAHDHQESITPFDISEIIENLEDLLDDDDDDDADDLYESVDDLDDENTSYGSLVENDLKDDLKYQLDEMLDGFERIRKGTYRTNVADIIAAIADLETELSTIENNFETVTEYDEIEDIEEDLQEILYRAKSYIFELRLRSFDDTEEGQIMSQVDSLAEAMSNTFEDLENYADSFPSYLEELEFDLFGTGYADIATSEFSILQEIYDAIPDTQANIADGQTTTDDLISYIATKRSSLATIDSGWNNITDSTEYREGEQDIIQILRDIEFEMYRLMPGDAIHAYTFETSINSSVIANNIGYYYQDLINEGEDKINMINSFISTDDNDDLEDAINDFYEVIDDSLSILQDAMVSPLDDDYTDIVDDIENEKSRLDRTFNSLNISNSSSSSDTILVQSIEGEFSDRESEFNALNAEMPSPISTYSEFDEVHDDLIDVLIETEKSVKLAHSRSLSLSDRESIQSSFDEMANELDNYLISLQENISDRVKDNVRDLKRTIKKDMITFKVIMDDIDIKIDDDDDSYNERSNLSAIDNQSSDINMSPDTFDDLLEYYEELEDFRSEARDLESDLYELIENKPELEEDQLDQLEQNYDTFQDGWDDTIDKFESVIFDDNDTDYMIDSFNTYMDRYYLSIDALFQSALNNYSEIDIVYTEIYDSEIETPEEEEIIEDVTGEPLKLVDTKFADVKKDNLFSPYVEILSENSVINGYEDGNFYPNRSVTRAEFIKMAVASKGVNDNKLKTDNINFVDVDKENALSPYIGYAVDQNYINGYNSEHFGPNDQITRIDAIRILIRILDLVSTEAPNQSEYFSDITTSDLATLTDRVYEAGIVSGNSDGTFKPYNSISRGETSKILSNAFFVEI